jgi:colicin import membrane protein
VRAVTATFVATRRLPLNETVDLDIDKRLQSALQRYIGESTEAGGQGFGAGRVGGTGMGGGVVVPPEVIAYKKLILARIKDAWRWFDPNSSLINQVVFEIEADGRTKNVHVVKSSGNSGFDDSVIRAVMKASPLPPPPPNVYEKFFKSVRVTFDPRE